MRLHRMACCGMREIADLHFTDGPKHAMLQFVRLAMPRGYSYIPGGGLRRSRPLRFSHVIFSQARHGDRVSYGNTFANFITKNGLGVVTASESERNPNTGNMVKFWVWTLNKPALEMWVRDNVLN